MNKQNFLKNYLSDLSNLILPDDDLINKLIEVSKLLISTKVENKKILIFGNGGSTAIGSHFSVDLTKNAKLRCVNFNEADLITCFANDYGFERWVEKAIEFYSDPGDIVILISSSGKSKNMLNAAKFCQQNNLKSVITFTGFDEQNPLSQQGDLNFWVDSKAYNFVENMHQIWLLAVVDLIIGKTEYLAN